MQLADWLSGAATASSTATQRINIADLAPGCYTLRVAGFAPARFTKR